MNGSRRRRGVKARRLRLNIDLDFLGVPVPINLELDEIIQLDDLGEKIERIVKSKIDEIKDAEIIEGKKTAKN